METKPEFETEPIWDNLTNKAETLIEGISNYIQVHEPESGTTEADADLFAVPDLE